jgi:hypothetical protein
MCPLRTQPGSTLAMAVMAVLLSPGAGATLIKSSGATNTACGVNAPWFWTIEPPEDGFVPSPTGPWTVSVRTAAAGGGTTVVATVQQRDYRSSTR